MVGEGRECDKSVRVAVPLNDDTFQGWPPRATRCAFTAIRLDLTDVDILLVNVSIRRMNLHRAANQAENAREAQYLADQTSLAAARVTLRSAVFLPLYFQLVQGASTPFPRPFLQGDAS